MWLVQPVPLFVTSHHKTFYFFEVLLSGIKFDRCLNAGKLDHENRAPARHSH